MVKGVIILVSLIFMILFFYILLKVWPKKGKLGINLKPVKCPSCDTPAPTIRKPKNFREALWGGWTCDNCLCEMDKYGKPIIKNP